MKKLSAWLNWVRNERENNFFFFCDMHYRIIFRPQDGVSSTEMAKTMPCDYPNCHNNSEWEYFPNLYPKFKNYARKQRKKIHNKRT